MLTSPTTENDNSFCPQKYYDKASVETIIFPLRNEDPGLNQ